MFLLVPAYPGCPGQTAVKWLLLLFLSRQCSVEMAGHIELVFGMVISLDLSYAVF